MDSAAKVCMLTEHTLVKKVVGTGSCVLCVGKSSYLFEADRGSWVANSMDSLQPKIE
jgi:hypothetical protein